MFAPRAFIYMVGVLIAFAVTTYVLTGSLYTTFVQTIACAVLVQVGYFCAVLFLVWKARRAQKSASGQGSPSASASTAAGEKEAAVQSVTAPLGRSPGGPAHS